MTSNFDFIQSPFSRLASTLKEAERQVYAAPVYAAVLLRKSLEEWVRWLYENDVDLEEPYDTSLNSLLHQQDFKDLLAPSLFRQVNLVRKLGNDAAHTSLRVKPEEAVHALQLMHGFTSWVFRVYNETNVKVPTFSVDLIPQPVPVHDLKREMEKLRQQLEQTIEINRKQEEELERLKTIKDTRQAAVPPPADPNEAVTRKLYINLLLKEAGWDPHGHNVSEYPVTGMPTGDGKNNGPGKVDYVLWGDDGKPLAVVEAKRTSRDARVGQNQAKLYADCLERMHGQRPLIFYTNGFETWLWDDTEYAQRRVHGFYKKDELQLLVQRRSTRQPLSTAAIDAEIVERYYQIEAIRSVAQVLENRGRDALLVMATGTGKTRTAAALVDTLSKSGWAKRILFLADRTALIYQAKNAFTNHLPHLPAIDLTKEKDTGHARVVFSTYQTMINQIDSEFDNDQRLFGVGHFDVVIFDEIHRSVYNRYKAIFEYFDAYRIGLTATPKSEGDRDTYLLFGLEPQNPTYAYELDQAVGDGFLVPPKTTAVPTKFQRQGIKYDELSPEEQRKYEEEFADPLTGEFPDEINSTALNSWLFNTDTVDKVLGVLMRDGIKVAGGDRLGKTIVFARSHKHAKFIEERFNKQYPQYKGDFCKVIDNYEEYAYDLLKNFSEKDKGPHIAVSVDMLDTGIDVPEVVNLVFFKPVRSRAKFWQMIGRGTRLRLDLFAPGEHKSHFLIFDCCENFEFFGKKPEGVDASQGKTLSQRLFEQRLKLMKLLQGDEDGDLRRYSEELQKGMVGQVEGLNEDSFLVRQHWRTVEKYRDPFQWNALNELDVKELVDHVAVLVTESDEDELAKRFDLLCYNIEVELVTKKSILPKLMSDVQELAAKLSKKGSIPAVFDKMQLIKDVQTKGWWKEMDVMKVEGLRRDLRHLIRFIDRDDSRIVYTNFKDELVNASSDFTSVYQSSNNLEAYKNRVSQFIQSKQTHMTIFKLRTNIPITSMELQALEGMLFEQGECGTREQFETAYGKQPLGKFIRSIVGLDVQAAKNAFGQFVNSPSLNPQQIRFLDTIINYLSVNGTIEPAALFEPPFTEIASNGLIDVFNQDDAAQIVSLVEHVNKNAVAVS
ncbi:DEAD/DEAH box helicase family protein [Flavisolibacter sp. BT320]|nr:DEAD/DEAH box helicase family protein [Flavisolibacter longurius]